MRRSRVGRAVENNIARDDGSKGSVLVRALLAGMTDGGAFLHLVERGHVPSLATIRSYRGALRALGRGVATDGAIRASRGSS